MIDDGSLRFLAATQHGLVAVHQVVALGYEPRTRDRLVDGHRWVRVAPRVLGLVGAPATTASSLMLSVLDAGPGAALGGATAAAWWHVPGNLVRPVQVVRPRQLRDVGQRVGSPHQPLLLPDHHVVLLDAVPTVVPSRALFDVAGTQRRGAELEWWVDRMARMVDTAWAMRLVSGRSLHAMLDELAVRGRAGVGTMRKVLSERGLDYVPPASGLESRVMQILARAGDPPLRRQVDTGDGDRWIGRVDFRDPDLPLVVEIQSERFHASLIDRQLDASRIERLVAAGFEVVELTDVDVWHRPSWVLSRIREGRWTARQRLHPAA